MIILHKFNRLASLSNILKDGIMNLVSFESNATFFRRRQLSNDTSNSNHTSAQEYEDEDDDNDNAYFRGDTVHYPPPPPPPPVLDHHNRQRGGHQWISSDKQQQQNLQKEEVNLINGQFLQKKDETKFDPNYHIDNFNAKIVNNLNHSNYRDRINIGNKSDSMVENAQNSFHHNSDVNNTIPKKRPIQHLEMSAADNTNKHYKSCNTKGISDNNSNQNTNNNNNNNNKQRILSDNTNDIDGAQIDKKDGNKIDKENKGSGDEGQDDDVFEFESVEVWAMSLVGEKIRKNDADRE